MSENFSIHSWEGILRGQAMPGDIRCGETTAAYVHRKLQELIDERDAALAQQPATAEQEPGLFAIHYRDNWDGEGDTYYLLARRTEDGRWMSDESGKKLLEYEGDAVLEAWPLTSGTTSDKYRAELYDETWGKARGMGYGNVTEALAELARMKAAERPDTHAVRDVLAERRRQVEAEGWTTEHDDEHDNGQMARAAACYALAGSCDPHDEAALILVDLAWPWAPQWWKPAGPRRDLVKAGALILAEIERLDRALLGKEGSHA